MELEMVVGPQVNADGAKKVARGVKNGALGVGDCQARFQEAVLRGNCFTVCNQTAVTIPAGLSASPTTVVLYNPAGSGKNLVVWHAGLANLIAWGAAAAVWVAVSRNLVAAAVTGTAAAARNLLAGAGAASVATPLTTATLPAAPVADFLLGAGLTGAITTVPQAALLERWFDGGLVLKPGSAASFQASTASGAGAFGEWQWEEVPE